MSQFLEMPNLNVAEESSADEITTASGHRARAENLTAIRLRDVQTGRFVAGAGLVTKSFVPGKGWVKATDVGARELRSAAKKRPEYFRKQKLKDKNHPYRADSRIISETMDEIERSSTLLMKGPKNSTLLQPWDENIMPPSMAAFAVQSGGRRGRRIMVIPDNTPEHVVRHEMAHVTPKRSGYRLWQTQKDPKLAMREEARADMAGGGTGQYYRRFHNNEETATAYSASAADKKNARTMRLNFAASPNRHAMYKEDALDGYRMVQDRIATAQRRTGYPAPSGSSIARGGSKKFNGNQYVDDKKVRRRKIKIITAESLTGGAAGGLGGYLGLRDRRVEEKARQNALVAKRDWRRKKKQEALDPRLSITLRRKHSE